jgi:purine-cytosine permease-like protein
MSQLQQLHFHHAFVNYQNGLSCSREIYNTENTGNRGYDNFVCPPTWLHLTMDLLASTFTTTASYTTSSSKGIRMSSIEILPKETLSTTSSPTGSLPPYAITLESEHNVDLIDAAAGSQPKRRWLAAVCSQASSVWADDSIATTDIILAALGPLRYHLSFQDACLFGIIGLTLGLLPVAFVSTFGLKTGHRTTMLNRLVMGRIPAIVMTSLNIATRFGGVIIELIVAGQILSAVIASRIFSTSVAIIVISATLSADVVVIGKKHLNSNYALFARGLVMFILASLVDYSKHSPATLSLSLVKVQDEDIFDPRFLFASLCIARTITYAPFAMQSTKSDNSSNRDLHIFTQSLLTHLPGFCCTFVVGAVIGEMTGVVVTWQEAYTKSTCSVLAEILQPTGLMLKLSCGVVLVIGAMLRTTRFLRSIVANLCDLNSRLKTVPAPIYPIIIIPICGLFAVLAKDHLVEVMVSIVSITGYLTSIWFAIFFVEYVLFNRCFGSCDEWLVQGDKRRYPFGLASSATFLLGCTVVVLCMTQTWYVGPLAHLSKHPGLDVSLSHLSYRSTADLLCISSRS